MPLFRNRGKNQGWGNSYFCRQTSCTYRLPAGCSWDACFPLPCQTLRLALPRYTVFFSTLSNHSKKPPHVKDCVAEIAKLFSTWASIQAWLWRDEPSLHSQLQGSGPAWNARESNTEHVPQKLFQDSLFFFFFFFFFMLEVLTEQRKLKSQITTSGKECAVPVCNRD